MLAFIFLILMFSNVFGECPTGWIKWEDNCFGFQNSSVEFASAEIICNGFSKINGHLASVHDGFTNALLADQGTNFFQESTMTDFWIGGTKLLTGKSWTWTDNTNFTFNEWASTEPQNLTAASCAAETISNGQWSAQDCFKQKPFVCAISDPLPPPASHYCGDGWIYFEPSGSCFGTDNNGTPPLWNWTTAEIHCETLGGHLPSIHSLEEWNFVHSFVRFAWRVIWVGLRSDDGGNTWTWSDKTPIDYTVWAGGYPKGGGCGAFYGIGIVNSNTCSEGFYYLCKKPAKF